MKTIIEHPNQERLRELFDYHDGKLIRRVSMGGRSAGQRLGYYDSYNGYFLAGLDGKQYRLHRLIWIWHYGNIPTGLIVDHQDGDKTNNRIENLRPITCRGNITKAKVPASGQTNIVFRDGRYEVKLYVNGKQRYYGRFSTIDEAVKKRDEIKREQNL